jgi:hypothetical protein
VALDLNPVIQVCLVAELVDIQGANLKGRRSFQPDFPAARCNVKENAKIPLKGINSITSEKN